MYSILIINRINDVQILERVQLKLRLFDIFMTERKIREG